MTKTHDMRVPAQTQPDVLLKELHAARAQLAKVKKRRARHKLDQYRSAILLLREHDASYLEIQKVLARHRIHVSAMTIRNSLLRWQQEETDNFHSTLNR